MFHNFLIIGFIKKISMHNVHRNSYEFISYLRSITVIISQSCSSAIPHYFPIRFVGTKFPPREPLSAKSQIASAGGSVFRQKKLN